MAINRPKFVVSTPDPPSGNPPLLSTNLTTFVSGKGFLSEREKTIYNKKGKKIQNAGFVNSAFESMMRSVGWQGGQAWCAYFIKIFYMQLFSFDRDWIAKNISAGCVRTWNHINKINKSGDTRYIAITSNTPQVGDIFIQQSIKKPSDGHIGMINEVIGIDADGVATVKTVEGNTSLKGAREGEGVFSLTRKLKVGSALGESKRLLGYVRRNFTESELNNMVFDESQLTYVFKNQPTSTPTKTQTTPKKPLTDVLKGLGSKTFQK
jgi:hypothetical protein